MLSIKLSTMVGIFCGNIIVVTIPVTSQGNPHDSHFANKKTNVQRANLKITKHPSKYGLLDNKCSKPVGTGWPRGAFQRYGEFKAEASALTGDYDQGRTSCIPG